VVGEKMYYPICSSNSSFVIIFYSSPKGGELLESGKLQGNNFSTIPKGWRIIGECILIKRELRCMSKPHNQIAHSISVILYIGYVTANLGNQPFPELSSRPFNRPILEISA
jgi:hypothetical protein